MNVLVISASAATRAWLAEAASTFDTPTEVNFSEDVSFAINVLQVHDDVHVILLDLDTVDGAVASTKELWRAGRSAAVVVVAERPTSASMIDCIRAGAMAYVPRSTSSADLNQILACVREGVLWLPHLAPDGWFRPC